MCDYISNTQEEIIFADKKNRHYGITDELIILDQLNDMIKNKFEDTITITGSIIVPPMHQCIQNLSPLEPNYSNENFISHIDPCVLEILQTVDNFALCGGSALWALMKTENSNCNEEKPNDWDLFYYGSPDQIFEKETDIYNIIIKHCKMYTFIKCKGITQFTTEKIKIQLIFRNYISISEIIHSFDISASSIAFDGRIVYFTKLFAWSFITKLIIISPEYRSNTYEQRLKKYQKNKTFGLIFKNIKITPGVKKINLPFCVIIINDIICSNLAIGYIKLKELNVIEYTTICNNYHNITKLDRVSNSDDIYSNNAVLFCNNKYNYFTYLEMSRVKAVDQAVIRNIITIKHILPLKKFTKWVNLKLKSIVELNEEYNYVLNTKIFDMLFNKYEYKNELKREIIDILDKTNNRLKTGFFVKKNSFKFNKKIYNNLKSIMDAIYRNSSNIEIDWCSYMDREKDTLTGSFYLSTKTDEEWYGDFFCTNESAPFVYFKEKIYEYVSNYNSDNICAICFQPICYFSKNAIMFICGHLFHDKKLIQNGEIICDGSYNWISSKKTCPICRKANPNPLEYF